jgi:hypothetical protein
MDVSNEKEFTFGDLVKGVAIALGIQRTATDSDPGAVERNREQAEAARAKRDRTVDEKTEEQKQQTDEKPEADKAKDEKPVAVENTSTATDSKSETKEATVPDKEEKELEKEEKGASNPKESKHKKAKDADKEEEKEMKDKKAKDADEEEEEKEMKDKKKASDAQNERIDKLVTAVSGLGEIVGKLVARDATKCTCDAEEGEKHKSNCPMFKSAEDELIPVATLPSEDLPKNPIPGADAAPTLEFLKKIAPIIAKSGDRQAIDAINTEYRRLKGTSPGRTGDGYRELADRGEKAREAGLAGATDNSRHANDSTDEKNAENFETMTKSYLGRHPGEVKIENKGGK